MTDPPDQDTIAERHALAVIVEGQNRSGLMGELIRSRAVVSFRDRAKTELAAHFDGSFAVFFRTSVWILRILIQAVDFIGVPDGIRTRVTAGVVNS